MAAAAAPACAEVASSGRVKGSRSTRGERWRRPWRGERVMQRPRRVETGAETWSGSETPRRRRHAPQAVGKKGSRGKKAETKLWMDLWAFGWLMWYVADSITLPLQMLSL